MNADLLLRATAARGCRPHRTHRLRSSLYQLCVLSTLSLGAAHALTTVSDTVYTATGQTPAMGSYLQISWPRFTSSSGHDVLPGSQKVPLAGGHFTVALEPTVSATFPFHYSVTYQLVGPAGPVPSYTESWSVPDTTTLQTVSAVLVTTPPPVSNTPPSMKGDLVTSDGDTLLRLPAPSTAGYVLETNPATPSGLNWQALQSLIGPPGPIGPQGIPGPQGPAGADGQTGAQGLAGPIGPIGQTGAAGPIGLTGAAGPQGPIGLTGPAGPIGQTGAAGPIGATGAAGAQGPIGLTGPAGATGAAGPIGPAGPTGATGAAGAQGPIGLTGPAGPAGPAGPTGTTGPVGATGAAGAQGPIGLTGPAGATGATGATGPIGPAGPAGATGAAGAQGPTGLTGPAGPTGTTGATGPAGPAGATGAQGPAGPAGSTLYGSYANLPATCTTGAFYVLTSGLFDSALCTATNTWTFYYEHRPITPAAKLSLATAGTAGANTTTNANGYEVFTAPPGGNGTLAFRYWTPPATPYVVTLPMRSILIDQTNYRLTFFGWGDTATGWEGLNCGAGSTAPFNAAGGLCRISKFNTAGSYVSGDVQAGVAISGGWNAVKYIQLKNDGTNLSIALCSDYDNCTQLGPTFATTSYLTGGPVRLAYGISNSAAAQTLNLTLIGVE